MVPRLPGSCWALWPVLARRFGSGLEEAGHPPDRARKSQSPSRAPGGSAEKGLKDLEYLKGGVHLPNLAVLTL